MKSLENKITIDAILESIFKQHKKNRLTKLNENELKSVWRDCLDFANRRLSECPNKSLFLPGLGYIIKVKKSDTFKFAPAQNWSALLDPLTPAYSPNPKMVESLNLNQVKSTLDAKSLELGYKEIVFRIKQNIQNHLPLHLDLAEFGYLDTKPRPLQFKLVDNNYRLRSKPKQQSIPDLVQPAPREAAKEQLLISPAAKSQTELPSLSSFIENLVINESFDAKEQHKQEQEVPEKEPETDFEQPLPKFVIWSLSNTHTHTFSGDRRWLNSYCGICRQMEILTEDEHHNHKEEEEEEDKHHLENALKDAQAFHDGIRDAKQKERLKLELMAMYNMQIAQQKKAEKIELPPIGDIFYKRTSPPDQRSLNIENAKELKVQMEFKEKIRKDEVAQKLYEERLKNQDFVQQFRKEQEETWLEKVKKQREQYNSLAKQLTHKPDTIGSRFSFGNLFARDESLSSEYRKLCAVEISKDQQEAILEKKLKKENEIISDKQETAARMLNAEIMQVFTNSSLKNDLDETRRIRFETRKYLEECWKRQMEEKVDEFAD